MKRAIKILILLLVLVFATYRLTMVSITPYVNGGTVYLEAFGVVDVYDVKSIKDLSSEVIP